MREPTNDEAPGWDAIDAALRAVHGDAEPLHRGLAPGVAFGSPLQGVSAYGVADHWHFVTYGLTELFAKESEVAEISGFEFYTLVGITPQALSEMQATSTAAVLERLAEHNPMLITDVSR